jgi:DNA-binding NarL/FixJ family response regulator
MSKIVAVEPLDEETAAWYKKLKEGGFEDIEVQLDSKIPYRRSFPDTRMRKSNIESTLAKERYSRVIGLLWQDLDYLKTTALTDKHILVLQHLAAGLTHKEIAEVTGINKKSVEHYIYNKLKKEIMKYANSIED